MCNKVHTYLHVVPCHRKESRSFRIRGVKMPMCSRCLGMVVGYVGIPYWYVMGTELEIWIGLLFTLLPVLTLIVDGFTQKWGWRESNNLIRVVTGFGSTFGLAYGVVWLINVLLRYVLTI